MALLAAEDEARLEYTTMMIPAVEAALSDAVDACFTKQPSDPLTFIAAELLRMNHSFIAAEGEPHVRSSFGVDDGAPGRDAAPPSLQQGGEGADKGEGEWSVNAWCASLGLHEHVATALLSQHEQMPSAQSQVAFIRSLASASSYETIMGLLQSGALLECIAKEVHRQAQSLARAEAATALELRAKFCEDGSSFAMTFSGLSTFFSGLEGLVGSPFPQVGEGMKGGG